MIRRLMLILALLAMLCGAAVAEDIYTPGEPTKALLAQAFDEGKIISATMRIDMDADPAAMGLSETDAAVFDVLSSSALTFGAAKLENGLRIELGAAYETETPVQADAALNISWDGLSVESSLIPGESFSADWTTLLTLAGLSQEDIDLFYSLKSIDFTTLAEDLKVMAVQYAELAGQFLAPYGQTITGFIAALPTQVNANVPAQYERPALAQERIVTITAKDLGALLTQLADQLEADAMIAPLLDMGFAQVAEEGAPKSTAELCAIAREAAGMLTDTTMPLTLVLGTNEAGAAIYGGLLLPVGEELLLANLTKNGDAYALSCIQMDADKAIVNGLTVSGTYAKDPVNPNIVSLSCDAKVYAEGAAVMAMALKSASVAADAGGLKGYNAEVNLSMDMDIEGEKLSVVGSAVSKASQTADGGETVFVDTAIDMYADSEQVPLPASTSWTTAVGADGLTIEYAETISLAEFGFTAASETISVAAKDYAPAQLKDTALATASEEDLGALMMTAMENGTALIDALAAQLPPALLEGEADESASSGLGSSIKALN